MQQKAARRQRSAITIREVASRAGVSPMTVSRVINDEKNVRPQTRQLVEEAIAALNYAPNAAARTLAGANPIRIGLLHRFPNASYLGEYLVGLMEETAIAHVHLIVRNVAHDVESARAVAELVDSGVAGVILPPPLADEAQLVESLRGRGLKVVTTGSSLPEARVASLGIDDRGAASTMTAHLVALGHQRIGFIKGHPSHASTALRLDGYRSALAEAGLPLDDALVAAGLYTYKSGLDAAELLLGLPVPPTAIFASNDDMAAATVAVAHRRGLDVPADVSVCGFDDTALATTIWPELTTIHQPIAEMSCAAVDTLVDAIRNGAGDQDVPHRFSFDYVLVRRQSDAPPRVRPPERGAQRR